MAIATKIKELFCQTRKPLILNIVQIYRRIFNVQKVMITRFIKYSGFFFTLFSAFSVEVQRVACYLKCADQFHALQE